MELLRRLHSPVFVHPFPPTNCPVCNCKTVIGDGDGWRKCVLDIIISRNYCLDSVRTIWIWSSGLRRVCVWKALRRIHALCITCVSTELDGKYVCRFHASEWVNGPKCVCVCARAVCEVWWWCVCVCDAKRMEKCQLSIGRSIYIYIYILLNGYICIFNMYQVSHKSIFDIRCRHVFFPFWNLFIENNIHLNLKISMSNRKMHWGHQFSKNGCIHQYEESVSPCSVSWTLARE